MCVVKTPKIKAPTQPGSDKPLPILTNPILDGIDPTTNSLRVGRRSLRIDRTVPPAPPIMGQARGTGLRIGSGG